MLGCRSDVSWLTASSKSSPNTTLLHLGSHTSAICARGGGSFRHKIGMASGITLVGYSTGPLLHRGHLRVLPLHAARTPPLLFLPHQY